VAAGAFVIFYSKVTAFRQCRKRYWFRYLSGEPPPPDVMNVPGLIGNAVHRGMRELAETGKAWIARNEVDVYLRMPGHEMCGPGTDGLSRALRYLEAGVDAHESIASSEAWAEKEVADPAGSSLQIRARVDRIDRLIDGSWQVIDWKTGGDFDDATDEQLDLAHLAMRSSMKGIMPKDAVVTTIAWNLRRQADEPGYTPRVRVLNRDNAIATFGKYQELARAMRETREFPAIPGPYCGFCEWRPRCPEAYPAEAEELDDAE
jgi:putative RecB family exonuclease